MPEVIDRFDDEYPDPDYNEDIAKYDPYYSGAQVSKWTYIVDDIAESVIERNLWSKFGAACVQESPVTEACWTNFFTNYGRKVFRRPLTSDEVKRYVGYVRATPSSTDAMRMAINVLFRSPNFIFHLENGVSSEATRVRLSDHEVANRLSFSIQGGPPDDTLSTAADHGELKTLAQVETQARRLMATPQAREKIDLFFGEWLQYSTFRTPYYAYFEWIMDLGKTGKFEEITRQEVKDFVDHITWVSNGSFQSLMTAPIAFPREEGIKSDKKFSALAYIYGGDRYSGFGPRDPSIPSPPFPAPNNPGLLTRAGLLLNSRMTTDPINRGAFVLRRILCQAMPTPDFTAINARLDEVGSLDPVTTPLHDIVDQKTAAPTCVGCHAKINPLGFALEGFDMIGMARTKETVYDMNLFYGPNRAVAATHPLPTPISVDMGGQTMTVESAPDFVSKIASSATAQRCMTTYVLRNFDRRMENVGDSCAVEEAAKVLEQGKPIQEVFIKSVANEDIFWRRK